MLSRRQLKAALDQKPGAEAGYPFGPGPRVYKIGGRIFAILIESEAALRLTLKCEPHLGELMRQSYAAIAPGYHTNKRHWITITQDQALPDGEILKLIDHAYDLVLGGLSKARRAALAREA